MPVWASVETTGDCWGAEDQCGAGGEEVAEAEEDEQVARLWLHAVGDNT